MKGHRKFRFSVVGHVFSIVIACAGLSACVSGADGLNDGGSHSTSSMQAAVPGASAGGLRVVKELPPPPKGEDGSAQQIARNDVLEIDVFQVDELDRTVQVDGNGNIALPLIGNIEAAGKSPSGLAENIAAAYGKKYLQSPQVSVFVEESVGQRAVVDGEVNKAGIYPVTADSSLLGLISQAGGLNKTADPTKIYVYRDYGDQKLVAQYSVREIRLAKKADPSVYGGDVVVVFSSATRVAMQNLLDVTRVAGSAALLIP